MKFSQILSFILLIIVCFSPMVLLAQPDPGGDPDVPIDGGLSLLLAAGVGYTIKRGIDNKKKKKAEGIDEGK